MLVPGISSPVWWDDPSCGRQAQAARHADKYFSYWGYACDPMYAGNSGITYSGPRVAVTAPQAAAPPQPAPVPPPTIRLEVREYHWPSSTSGSGATTFSIISKDGSVQSATAWWVQDGSICFITPDGSQHRIPIDSVDHKATPSEMRKNS